MTGPYRDGVVHVLSEKCRTCIFRPGNPMRLQPGRVQQMVDDSLKAGGAITCHQTLAYGGYEAEGEAICRGFFEAHHHRVLALRLALVEDAVVYDAPPALSRRRRAAAAGESS